MAMHCRIQKGVKTSRKQLESKFYFDGFRFGSDWGCLRSTASECVDIIILARIHAVFIAVGSQASFYCSFEGFLWRRPN